MSDLQYTTRLRWDGRQGIAKLHGRTMQLTVAPWLAGPVWSVDYVPEDGIAEIAPRSVDPRRRMEPVEIAAADALLLALFAPAEPMPSSLCSDQESMCQADRLR